MSKFFSERYGDLVPYTPGEQPGERKFIKLNTNESPFSPADSVKSAAEEAASSLNLYSDPECRALTEAVAEKYGLAYENVLMTNGSDEILNFAFMAFGDEKHPFVFPDITYGFYPVFAKLNHVPYETVPLLSDFTIDYRDYCGINKNIVIANPNAPTGILMPLCEIEEIVKSNPQNVIVIDEAYIDFSDKNSTGIPKNSAVNLLSRYDNLLVTMTFSKSRSLAGARLGFGLSSKDLISDLRTMKYSTNPYNINSMTQVAGLAVLHNDTYYDDNCRVIMKNREFTSKALTGEGFKVLPSSSNFVFAKADWISGRELYSDLRKEGILVRHFDTERLKSYLRISIGSREQMEALIAAVKKIKAKE